MFARLALPALSEIPALVDIFGLAVRSGRVLEVRYMEQEGTSLSSSTHVELSRPRARARERTRIRVLRLEPDSIVVKDAPEPVKELPGEDALAERGRRKGAQISADSRPFVPPPPPWDEERSVLTSLVSEALRALPELAVGVSVGEGEGEDEDEDEDEEKDAGRDDDGLVELDAAELQEIVEPSASWAGDGLSVEIEIVEPSASWAGDGLSVEIEIVDVEVEDDAKVEGLRRVEELDIDLGDLSQRKTPPRRLLDYLRDRFFDVPEQVDEALAAYRGKYASISDYVREVIAGESISDWLRPYIDVDALAQDWCRAGIIWAINDPGGNGEEPGLHVFLS